MSVNGVNSYVPSPFTPEQSSGTQGTSTSAPVSGTTTTEPGGYVTAFSALRANGLPAPSGSGDQEAMLTLIFSKIEEMERARRLYDIRLSAEAVESLRGQLEDIYVNQPLMVAEHDEKVIEREALITQRTELTSERDDLIEESNKLAGKIEEASGDKKAELIEEKAEVDAAIQALNQSILTLDGEINTLTFSIDELTERINMASIMSLLLVSMIAWDNSAVNLERDGEDRARVEHGERLLEMVGATAPLALADDLFTLEFREQLQELIQKHGADPMYRNDVLKDILAPFPPQSYGAVDSSTASLPRDGGGRLQVPV